ncbi:NAD(P)-dependent oxidoreductase [Paracoccus siganidrum]|uniref:NAD(P)-dependent oxidoreductase n=1 Tax=Paracoccus siganidrum TaxID=1276757 RepID=A0A418ZZD3_9RHOB|nr:NAD(P)-dependent oxidoreductase [Paracoccus siganidrum]RJL05837.1 NAD(P)-dependent oxidoreductase [Paracoccus siganidrum]RMC38793.1 NAD(P)-dependent oxidoreductase [Paracoccus siganidrum]
MGDVTMIGLGEMGGAMARAFLRAGHDVTVWNRTSTKAEQVMTEGAHVVRDVLAAIEASPIILTCVSSYATARALLDDQATAEALAGRTLVQLGSGTPQEARDMQGWVLEKDAQYLDAALLGWPRQIGTAEMTILVSGDTATFEAHRNLLGALAGNLVHMGEPIGLSSTVFSAVLSYLAGRWIGLCHGALICEAEGFGVAAFGEILAQQAQVLGEDARHMGEVIEKNEYDNPESTLETAGNDIIRLMQLSREAGINAEFPVFAGELFRRAIEAGHGAQEHAALIKLLRAGEA